MNSLQTFAKKYQQQTVSVAILVMGLLFPFVASAGSQEFNSAGDYTFWVPAYTSLTIQAWGAGGGGGGMDDFNLGWAGGGQNSWTSPGPWVGGGGGAQSVYFVGPTGGGGGGSGGNGNNDEEGGGGGGAGWFAGIYVGGTGGGSPNGGGGTGSVTGFNSGYNGNWPGGGGGGAGGGAGGGGGGGYTVQTYNRGDLSVGSGMSVHVGYGGGGGGGSAFGGSYHGGSGASGRVVISWNSPNCSSGLNGTGDGGGLYLYSGWYNYLVNSQGFYFCVNNSSGNAYFIPTHTQGELQSFYNAVSRLPGVWTSSP